MTIWGDVSMSDCAELLTNAGDEVTRSGLTKYVKRNANALPSRRDRKAKLVNFEDVAAYRARDLGSPAAGLWAKAAEDDGRPWPTDRLQVRSRGKEIIVDFEMLHRHMKTNPDSPIFDPAWCGQAPAPQPDPKLS